MVKLRLNPVLSAFNRQFLQRNKASTYSSMKKIFQPLPATFLFPLLFLFPLSLFSQLSGKVLDDSGEPLPFASVYVRNSTNGTAANAEGEYRLSLEKGTYEIVFQYIGYKQKVEKVTIGDKPVRLNARMEPANLEISEVVITTEDPAYRIMREVIAKRSYYKNKAKEYTVDVYMKGFYKLLDAPKKILGQDIGNMGGILDTNRQGVIYLSESVSKVYAQAKPERKKEVMISSKVSGSDNGFSFNRATYTDFNLYDEKLEIEREILSPLADNAFAYYTFKLQGKYRDENGYDIYKIGVIPKRPADPTFSGNLYVVEPRRRRPGAHRCSHQTTRARYPAHPPAICAGGKTRHLVSAHPDHPLRIRPDGFQIRRFLQRCLFQLQPEAGIFQRRFQQGSIPDRRQRQRARHHLLDVHPPDSAHPGRICGLCAEGQPAAHLEIRRLPRQHRRQKQQVQNEQPVVRLHLAQFKKTRLGQLPGPHGWFAIQHRSGLDAQPETRIQQIRQRTAPAVLARGRQRQLRLFGKDLARRVAVRTAV
jgi:hypothetical protein